MNSTHFTHSTLDTDERKNDAHTQGTTTTTTTTTTALSAPPATTAQHSRAEQSTPQHTLRTSSAGAGVRLRCWRLALPDFFLATAAVLFFPVDISEQKRVLLQRCDCG